MCSSRRLWGLATPRCPWPPYFADRTVKIARVEAFSHFDARGVSSWATDVRVFSGLATDNRSGLGFLGIVIVTFACLPA